MGVINMLKYIFYNLFSKHKLEQDFDVSSYTSIEMDDALRKWDAYYRATDGFIIAPVIASEAARLATIEFNIKFGGISDRRDFIEKRVNKELLPNIRRQLEYGCAYGSLLIKPNIDGIDFIKPNGIIPLEFDSNNKLTSVICIERKTIGKSIYSKVEKCTYKNNVYTVETKAYRSSSPSELGFTVPLSDVLDWKNIKSYVTIKNVDRPLFSFFRCPMSNNIDIDSPLGVSIYSKALKTLEQLNITFEHFNNDIDTSDKVVFVADYLLESGGAGKKIQKVNPLPKLVKGLNFTTGNTDIFEFVPEVRGEQFRGVMQTLLDILSMQCGFDTGYFTFDANSRSVVTATQIEADMQKTISSISDIQKELINCVDDVIYSLNVLADLYESTKDGKFDYNIASKDFNVNTDEDRSRALQLVDKGIIPKWKYLVDYEGYSKEDAIALVNSIADTSSDKRVGENTNNSLDGSNKGV